MTKEIETTVDGRVYEISYFFDNKIEESAALLKAAALKQSIATLGGSFVSEEAPYMREMAYEMIRVVNNVNIRFNEGYFGWIKFDLSADKVKEFEKGIKADEEVVRYLIVRTVAENTVFTKRAPVIKAETLPEILGEGVIDVTEEALSEVKAEESVSSEEKKEEVQ
jgi:ribosomal protein S6